MAGPHYSICPVYKHSQLIKDIQKEDFNAERMQKSVNFHTFSQEDQDFCILFSYALPVNL